MQIAYALISGETEHIMEENNLIHKVSTLYNVRQTGSPNMPRGFHFTTKKTLIFKKEFYEQ